MLVKRKDDPNRWEWRSERYIKPGTYSVYKEEEGVFEVYHNRVLIGTADNETEADEIAYG